MRVKHNLSRNGLAQALPFRKQEETNKGFEPQQYPLEDCKYLTRYHKERSLIEHLYIIHRILKQEAQELILLPFKRQHEPEEGFQPQKCPLEECEYPTKYYKENKSVIDLVLVHGLRYDLVANANSLQDALEFAAVRRDKTIQ